MTASTGTAASPAGGARLSFTSSYRLWLVGLLVAIYTTNFIDRIIIASLAPRLRQELHLSATQIGLLGGIAFALFYSVLAIPIARLAERRKRTRIIAVATALWSAATALCGLAQNFWQLLLFRVGVGVGEAGLTPSAYSLLSDHFPRAQRASAIAIFNLGVPLGSMLGALLGGWTTQHYGWRAAFLLVGLPGLVLAVLARLTLRDPPRGYSDTPDERPASETRSGREALQAPSLRAALRTLASKPAFIHIVIGCCLNSFANFGINLFLPSLFTRSFGVSLTSAGLLFGVLTGGAGVVGTLLAGFGADYAARRDERWTMWLPAIGLLAGAVVYGSAVLQGRLQLAFPLMMGASICFYFWSPTANGSVQNMVPPQMRASAAAILSLFVNTVGTGCGPLFVGFLTDRFAEHLFKWGSYASACPGGMAPAGATSLIRHGCEAASGQSIRLAIVCTCAMYLWAALHFLLASRHLRRDLEPHSTLPHFPKTPSSESTPA